MKTAVVILKEELIRGLREDDAASLFRKEGLPLGVRVTPSGDSILIDFVFSWDSLIGDGAE